MTWTIFREGTVMRYWFLVILRAFFPRHDFDEFVGYRGNLELSALSRTKQKQISSQIYAETFHLPSVRQWNITAEPQIVTQFPRKNLSFTASKRSNFPLSVKHKNEKAIKKRLKRHERMHCILWNSTRIAISSIFVSRLLLFVSAASCLCGSSFGQIEVPPRATWLRWSLGYSSTWSN